MAFITPGYTDGANAGSVTINATQAALEGSLKAKTQTGSVQRSFNKPATGGTLALSLGRVATSSVTDSALIIANVNHYLAPNFTDTDLLPDDRQANTVLDSSLLANGFNHLTLNSVGSIDVNSTLSLDALGLLSMSSKNINIHQNIIAPGANISANAGVAVVVDDAVKISAAGLWTNDTVGIVGAGNAAVAKSAGSIALKGPIVSLGNDSVLDASTGAWLQANGGLSTGSAGNITLDANGGSLQLKGAIQAFGFDKGGELSVLTAQNLQIGGQDPNVSNLFWLSPDFFTQGGFSKYNLTASNVTIGDTTGAASVIHPVMQTWVINTGAPQLASGADMTNDVTHATLLPDFLRKAASLNVTADTALPGSLTLLANTSVVVDDGGSVSLTAGKNLWVFGDVTAQGGNIKLSIGGTFNNLAYDATQSIWVGENAHLDASGYYRHYVDSTGLTNGVVADAGTIAISANRGEVVLKQGSVLDVSGVAGALDVKTPTGNVHQMQYANAGTISVKSREGMMLDGTLKANASGTAAGGLLDLALIGSASANGDLFLYPSLDRVFNITQQQTLVASAIHAGDVFDSALNGRAAISADQINQGGFDRVNITSSLARSSQTGLDRISLASGLNLHVNNALTLDSPLLQVTGHGQARLSADVVTIKNSQINASSSTTSDINISKGDSASLRVDASWIDLIGQISVDGVAETQLNASADIRGRGVNDGGYDSSQSTYTGGWLMVPDQLKLTARQVYPATNAAFRLEAEGTDSRVTVNSSGQAPTGLYSAGGALYLSADYIDQNGVLKAPFGLLDLNADKKITLSDGSLTSVSGEGLSIPYGTTSTSGVTWLKPTVGSFGSITQPAAKRVKLTSDDIQLNQGATVSLAGNGDMFAYEFIAGIGGSTDILAQPGVYAILPSLGASYAPYDFNYSSGSTLKAGDAVYLSGVTGLAAGTYTLLPARYALLAGAYMINTNTGSKSVLQGQSVAQVDGSSLVSGYFTNAIGTRDAAWSTFNVTAGSIFHPAKNTVSHSPSEYLISSANSYFADTANTAGALPRLPIDAGQLVLDAASRLSLNGSLDTSKATGGRGSLVDIASSNTIRVVSAIDPGDTSSLQIESGALSHLNAESLLLGGIRTQDGNTTTITTRSQNVKFDNDSAHPLVIPELIATASDEVDVSTGASIDTGAAANKISTNAITLNGDGALVAFSNFNDLSLTRTATTQATGVLNVNAGANLHAGRSAVLDATDQTILNSGVVIGDHGSLTLGANHINIGTPDIAGTGLTLDANKLASLSTLANLNLNSYGNIDVYGGVTMGAAQQNITMNSAGIAGHLAANETATINANQLTLKNSIASTFTQPSASGANSQLHIVASKLNLVGKSSTETATFAGKTVIDGFENVVVDANELVLAGAGSTTLNAANTSLNNARIVAATGTDFLVGSTSGNMQVNQSSATVNNPTSAGLGAKVGFSAANLSFGGDLEMPSGLVSLTSSNGDLNVVSGAVLNAGSKAVQFYDKTVYSAGGVVTLTSATGNVALADGASVNVAGAGEANAGKLNLIAKSGSVSLAGNLQGSAATGQTSGSLNLDAGAMDAASMLAINQKLNAGGFNESRVMRVRTGDVTIDGTGTSALQAREVEITADAGAITVNGDINATSAKDANIRLYAKNDLTLSSGSNLNAASSNADAAGGKVLLSSISGNLNLASGSQIDVRGGVNATDGRVSLRALRTGAGSGNGVKVTALNSTIRGANADVDLEAYKLYSGVTTLTTGTTNTTTLGFGKIDADNTAFMANKNAIVNALGQSGDNRFHLKAGVEVQSSSNLAVAADWNLYSTSRAGGQPGVLTLRATGDVNVNGSVSDGFVTAANTALLGVGDSWSYRIVAGADRASANLMNTNNNLTGNLNIANDKLIRTGSGSIDLAAGNGLNLGNAGSVIYTAGVSAATLAGFVAPSSTLKPMYLTDGGDISINVKGNITGKVVAGTAQQLVNQWLFREGGGSTSLLDTTWWVRPDLFKQGVATFGGGDITINAGKNITDFSASLPTTARYASNGTSRIDGGGDLRIHADGDINSGVYFVARGQGDITADGSIASPADNHTFGTVLALQDANFNVKARNGAFIESVFNPTLFAQSSTNASNLQLTSGLSSYFNTYSSTASVDVASLTSDVTFGLTATISDPTGTGVITNKIKTGLVAGGFAGDSSNSLFLYPATLNATAYSGSISGNTINLMPSASGDLNLLANNNINVTSVLMSDASVNDIASISHPVISMTIGKVYDIVTSSHASVPLHQADTKAAYVVAKDGSVILSGNAINNTLGLSLPKPVKLVAGLDVLDLNAMVQHNNANELTVVQAGRDYSYSPGTSGGLTVSGPGNVLVSAERNIDLGASTGVVTVANTTNSALSATGASITMLAGMGEHGANISDFIATYINPQGAGPAILYDTTYTSKLAGDKLGATTDHTQEYVTAYRAKTAQAVAEYMRGLRNDNSLSEADAMTQYLHLDAPHQAIFAYRQFNSLLGQSAKNFSKTQTNAMGDNAIASLFPKQDQSGQAISYSGNLSMYQSQIKTLRDGSIDIVVPGGYLNAGLPGGAATGNIGIVTEHGGDIRAFTESGFVVNQSKVITQYGSDITVWVNNGDIDAGRGSKTTVSVPERVVSTDSDGNTTIEFKGVAAGSGIRAQTYDPDGPTKPLAAPKLGTVVLAAPRGILNAGEAGIAAGDFVGVAPVVLGASNITVAGTSSGVPAADTGALSGALAGVSNVASGATNAATEQIAKAAQAASTPNISTKPLLPAFLNIEVIGLGE